MAIACRTTAILGLGLLGMTMVSVGAQTPGGGGPAPASCGDPALAGGLRLCLQGPSSSQLGHAIALRWEISNHTRQPVRLASHIEAGSHRHFDQVVVRVCGPMPRDASTAPCRDVPLSATRMASVPVQCELFPGEALRQPFDLAFWLSAKGIALAPGTYSLQAIYLAPPRAEPEPATHQALWTGELRSPTITLELAAP